MSQQGTSRVANHLRMRASRARAFESSPWSEATDLIKDRPDAIYFGDGAPNAEVQPFARLQEAAVRAWADAPGNLGYGELAGYAPLRELIAERMQVRGIHAGADEIMITNGSQQGIDLIARLMLDPGDAILVEGPTYIGAMQTFDAYEVDYVVIPMDDEGIDVVALDEQLERMERKPKLLYTIPAFQNPTGASISLSAANCVARAGRAATSADSGGRSVRRALVRPATRARTARRPSVGRLSRLVLQNDRTRIACRLDGSASGHAGSAADGEGRDRYSQQPHRHAHGLPRRCDFLDVHVAGLRDFYGARRDVLIDGLTASMPSEIEWNVPGGGFFLWIRLPENVSANQMLVTAAQHDVAYLPGSWFYPLGDVRYNELRLSFSSLPVDRIQLGAKRLGEAATDFLRNEECH